MMCVTKIVVDVAKEHRDLERFGSPKCNNLHPLFVYRCGNELHIFYKETAYALLYLRIEITRGVQTAVTTN
jgi:hypothetical protein